MSENFVLLLPNRMPYTNPGAISNSGNKYFTNQKSKVLKLNMGIIDNSNAIQNYQSAISSEQVNVNSNTNTQTDFRSVLSQQKNSSKTNKLSQSNEFEQSTQAPFQL